MSSIFTGVAGMQATQMAVDVIGNNIANMNTVGFKASRVAFEETLAQTLQGASEGINPLQIGIGVGISSIDNIMTQGDPLATGRKLDLALVGGGYFVATDGTTTSYTRDGIFQLNSQQQLVLGSNGMKIIGWQTDPTTGILDTTVQPQDILSIPLGSSYAKATSNVILGGNLNATGTTSEMSVNVFDSLGTSHEVKIVFTNDPSGAVDWVATSADGTIAPLTGGTITFGADGHLAAGTTATIGLTLAAANGATTPVVFDVDMSNISRLDGADNVQAVSQDGVLKGVLLDYSIGADGKIFGSYSNGASQVLGQIAIASFSNPAGLNKEGANLWSTSPNSGLAALQTANSSGTSIRSGYLENSNVDLATEFANLIIAQRSFQANSRSITTGDEMLQELMQLKR